MPKRKRAKPEPDLRKEVTTLATRIVSALRTARDSEELKSLKQEARNGLRAAGNRIVEAVETAKESAATRKLKSQAKRVLDIGKDRTGKTVKDFSGNLARGLQTISQELNHIAERLKK